MKKANKNGESAQAGDKPRRKPTLKQQRFTEEVLKDGNATRAARVAGYKHPNKRGPENVVKRGIQERIKSRIEDAKIQTNEVIGTLASQLRADLAEIIPDSAILQRAQERGLSHLIKKLKTTERTTKDGELVVTQEIEIYSAQEAAKQLCAVFGLNKLPGANPNDAARETIQRIVAETGMSEEAARAIVAPTFGISEQELVIDTDRVM